MTDDTEEPKQIPIVSPRKKDMKFSQTLACRDTSDLFRPFCLTGVYVADSQVRTQTFFIHLPSGVISDEDSLDSLTVTIVDKPDGKSRLKLSLNLPSAISNVGCLVEQYEKYPRKYKIHIDKTIHEYILTFIRKTCSPKNRETTRSSRRMSSTKRSRH